jgi:hypothetical protein
MKIKVISQQELKELVEYNPETGVLMWRVARPRADQWSNVGSLTPQGYLRTSIRGRAYFVHSLIWLYVYGYFPENDIDHIDRVKTNNCLGNLRVVSKCCSAQNKSVYKNNKSGIKGVHWCNTTQRWRVCIVLSKGQRVIGSFEDFTEAVCLRLAAEQCLDWGSCDKHSSAQEWVKKNVQNKYRWRPDKDEEGGKHGM